MSKYNSHAGHSLKCRGAKSVLDETVEARKVNDLVIKYLKQQGHTVYNCTDDNGTTQSKNLVAIVNKCNQHKVDLDISIHFNSGAKDKKGNKKTTGVEVFVYTFSTKARKQAKAICNEIAKLGFKNRGVKNSASLYVLRKTKSPALLIECCFVDDKDDADLYNADKMAKAIVKGITGKEVTNPKPVVSYKAVDYHVEVTAKSGLNCRKEPKATATKVTAFAKGSKLHITREQNGFLYVSGKGWVSAEYTKKVGSTAPSKPKPTESKPKPSTPTYKVGGVYTLQTEVKVRTGAGTNYRAKKYSELTADGRKHDKDGDGALEKGTKVTCQKVVKEGNNIWIKTPSGYIAAYYKGNTYAK